VVSIFDEVSASDFRKMVYHPEKSDRMGPEINKIVLSEK
jgi:hypothetical protein